MSPIKEAIEALEKLLGLAERMKPPGYPKSDVEKSGEAALAALRSMPAEPYGQVTVVKRPGCQDQHWFYRWPDPPYLDNAAECVTVYTTPPPAPVLSDAEIEPSDADWADFGAWAERDKGAMDMLGKLIDVWDDGQLPYEHRCYVDGAWSELIAEAKSMVEQAIGRASREASK